MKTKAYRTRAEDLIPMAWHAPWTPTEAEFTRLFLKIARAKGWTRRYHTRDSRGSGRGFPDWVLVNRPQRRLMFVELKGFAGKASDEQREWLGDLDYVGAEAYLLTTTGDYARDAASIVELLTRRPARVLAAAGSPAT